MGHSKRYLSWSCIILYLIDLSKSDWTKWNSLSTLAIKDLRVLKKLNLGVESFIRNFTCVALVDSNLMRSIGNLREPRF